MAQRFAVPEWQVIITLFVRIPLVAVEGQHRSTTGNISLFKGVLVKRNPSLERSTVFLLDLEGENGNVPKALEQDIAYCVVKP